VPSPARQEGALPLRKKKQTGTEGKEEKRDLGPLPFAAPPKASPSRRKNKRSPLTKGRNGSGGIAGNRLWQKKRRGGRVADKFARSEENNS